jgi:cobalt-zinc-cadmium efflux system membrane fusion protein
MKNIRITTFLMLLLLVSCSKGKNQETESQEVEMLPDDIVELREDQIKLAEVETGQIEMMSMSGILTVNGKVSTTPQDVASVCFPFGGFVKSINVTAGSTVSKGQTIAIIENQDFIDIQQNYLETKNKLSYAKSEYTRHNQLYKDDVYSEKDLQQVTTEYNNLKAQFRVLQEKLSMIGINPTRISEENITSRTAVKSPISGNISKINISIGKYVAPSDIMIEIVNADKLLLELTLFEKDADKVFKGQKIHFYINNESEQHDAVIYQTSKSIDNDKSFKVYANVSGHCKNVLPGMYVNANIETSSQKTTAIPSESIVSFDDKEYIFVFLKEKVEDGKNFTEYRMIQVKKGVTNGKNTEVFLPDGFDVKNSKIVIRGAYNLLSAKKNAGEMAC